MSDGSQDSSGPSNRMRERVSGGRFHLWFLLGADRRVVTALLVGAVFAALMALGILDPVPLSVVMQAADPVETLFQGLTGAIITGVTLVVTLSQLVLSQELGPVGDQRQRMEGAMDFREESEDVLGVPIAPPEPSAYLHALVSASETHAERLMDRPTTGSDADEDVRDYAGSLAENARQVKGNLDGAQFGTFDALSAALNYNYSWKIYEARKLKKDHADALSDETTGILDELLEVLRFFGPAREHFKSLYFEWTIVDLSRAMIYTAIPALIVAVGSLLYLGNPQHIASTTLGVDDMTWLVSAAVTISVVPFALLLSYMLRIVTIAKRTLAIGPFVLRETDRTEDID